VLQHLREHHAVALAGGEVRRSPRGTDARNLMAVVPAVAARADLHSDGDLDLATAGKLFVNQGTGGHWLKVHLEGDGETVNRSAIGAQVRVTVDGKTLTRQVEAGTGEGNQNDLTLHFGLGAHDGPVSLEIVWPGGARQTVPDVEVDHVVSVPYGRPR